GLPLEQMKGILRRKQVELHQHLEEEQAKLERVETRLRQLEQEETTTSYEVVIKKVEPMRVATVRGVIPTYAHICDLFDELCPSLAPQRTSFTGPAMAIYSESSPGE
ncbi:MAG: MerR family transcriptional regulator, partial [Candidatus Atribacteria bacterium]|nr:MerR family transcriptional regulator [Candidatus Atribacteria bacterium]